ncbi:hypothetical protein PAXINDRAFT_155234 [Paxillus involutus ATCC 200175]|nr:hypothetical protein PAXINDRAFT_155234 [Paxillus involutus ATCC 200175]
MSETVSKAVLARIATLETEMEAKKTQVLSSKASATRPKPKVRTRTRNQAEDIIPEAVEASEDAEGATRTVEGPVEDPVATEVPVDEFDEDTSEDGEGDNGMQQRVSKRPAKSNFRERVKEAHRMLDQPSNDGHEAKKLIHAAGRQTASKGNSFTTTTKASLTGLVRNWASAVVPSSSSKGTPHAPRASANHAVTGLRSKEPSTTTRTSGAIVPPTPAHSVADTSSVCIAGLGEGEDDLYEHPVGTKCNVDLKGKDARKVKCSITQ